MSKINSIFKKLANVKSTTAVAGLAFLSTMSLTVPVHAQNADPLFEKVRDLIFGIVGSIGAFIIVPVGILGLIINIVMMITDVMTGNTQRVGGKIAWMIGLVVLIMVGMFLGTSARNIFGA
jgi:hypothetical protein